MNSLGYHGGRKRGQRVVETISWRRLLCLGLGLLLVACSSHSVKPLLEAGQHVEVVGVRADTEALHADNKSDAAAKETRRGMLGGVGGGAISSVRCGVGIVVCLPLFVVMGGVAGPIEGHKYGTKIGLSDEHAKSLNAITNRIRKNGDLESRLVEALNACNTDRGQTNATDAATGVRVDVQLTEADLVQLPNEMIRLALVVRMTVADDPNGAATRPGVFEYTFTSDPASADAWSSSDGERLSTEIDRGFAQLASGMAWTLWGPGAVRRDAAGGVRCRSSVQGNPMSSASTDPTISRLEKGRMP